MQGKQQPTTDDNTKVFTAEAATEGLNQQERQAASTFAIAKKRKRQPSNDAGDEAKRQKREDDARRARESYARRKAKTTRLHVDAKTLLLLEALEARDLLRHGVPTDGRSLSGVSTVLVNALLEQDHALRASQREVPEIGEALQGLRDGQ